MLSAIDSDSKDEEWDVRLRQYVIQSLSDSCLVFVKRNLTANDIVGAYQLAALSTLFRDGRKEREVKTRLI
jgi:hypothetical protein